MKKFLFENTGLKVLALIIACIVWFLVVNANDPIITRSITGVPVQIVNTEYVESLGLSATTSDAGYVTVTLTGNRSKIEPISKEDVYAEADLTQIISMDANPIMVPANVSVNGIGKEEISVYPGNVQIVLEQTTSSTFIVTPSTEGTAPNSSRYEVGTMSSSMESITIAGPKSLLDIIDKVVAPVDVTNVVSDTSIQTRIVIYDKNGDELSESERNNLKFPSGGENVLVKVDVWNVINDITLNAKVTGKPANGYKVGDISITPQMISMTGTDDEINKIKENGNVIDITAEDLDVSGRSSAFEAKIDLEDVLSDDLRVASDGSIVVIVNVDIIPQDSKTFTLPTTGITQNNLKTGNAVVFAIDTLKVIVQGDDADLKKLSEGDIALSIDLANKNVGKYENETVNVSLPDGCSLVEPVKISYEIVEIQNP